MSETSRPLRIAVLGAGPIGIEAALYGATLGHEVFVVDSGAVGQSVSMWSHVTMFSPWRMNTTPLGLRTLSQLGHKLPNPEHCPTAAEYLAEYLLPLSQSAALSTPGRLRLHTKVLMVGRSGLLKGDLIAQAARADHHFRLLVEDKSGEHIEHADVVLDCTGTFSCPNPIGDGGIYAPGERWLGGRLIRHLPDVIGRDRKRFARRRTLLVGDGLSAATAATGFGQLCLEEPGTEVCWSTRTKKTPPYELYEGDPLYERVKLLNTANRVAAEQRRGVSFHPGTVVDALFAEGHQLRVRLRAVDGPDSATQEALFDEVIGLTGYGPERAIYEQLQIHECYASFGPMKLAATLVGASGDCLAQPVPGPETLKNPEPAFFILGAKSYARSSAFLLQIGHAQVRAVFSLLHKNDGLDLYAQA